MRSRSLRSLPTLLLTATLAFTGCDSDSMNDAPDDSPLEGGIVATFESEGEAFSVWITNATTIQQVMALQAGTSDANIPNGRIRRGPGTGDHNDPWTWHLDPEEIEMAEATIEVCDGSPSYVEDHVDEYVDTVGHYCPWGADLVRVEDYR